MSDDPSQARVSPQEPSPDLNPTRDLEPPATDCAERPFSEMAHVLERISDAFVALDMDWRYTYVNQRAAQILGRRAEDLIGRHIWTEFPERTGQPFYDACHKALAGQAPLEVEEYCPLHDRWLENRIYPSQDGLSIFFQDVTERRRDREQIRESERRLAEAQRLAGLGSWEWNMQTGEVSWSQELLRMVAWDSDAPPPNYESGWTLVHPGDFTRVTREVTNALARGGEIDFENRLLCADGREIHVHNRGYLVRDAAGQPLRLIAVAQDLTDRRSAEAALEESREHLRTILESAPVSIVISRMSDGTILYANPFARQLFGVAPDADVSRHVVAEFYQDPADRVETVGLLALHGFVGPRELSVKRLDGTPIWAEGSFQRLTYRGEEAVLATHHDITRRRATEQALAAGEEHLSLILRNVEDVVFLLKADPSETYRFLFMNRSGLERTGLPEERIIGKRIQEVLPESAHALVLSKYAEAIRNRQTIGWQETSLYPAGERVGEVRVTPLFDEQGRCSHLLGVIHDITERKQIEAMKERFLREVQERVDRDPLTELLNHRTFQKRLADEAARAQREGTSLAVVMLDLDNFKFFNDVYGHAVGDDVLRLVAQRLEQVSRPYDTVARFGGDEFAMVMPGVGNIIAAGVEARLRADLGGLVHHAAGSGEAIPITVSVGAALFPSGGQDPHEALRQADERLRRSKTGGSAETEADQMRGHMRRSLSGFSMLDALVTAVDNKDRYTRRHSEDVMEYSLMIARELGMDESALRAIGVASLLHDVGKIGVPDAVLRKPGKLTDAEFEAVKQHPMMGAALVSTVRGLEDTLDAVRHHHERWDGGGYPFGLVGEECPQIARLMAVADAFSAMTTDRPYRKGMDRAEALAILEAGAGTQWDPQCVASFVHAHHVKMSTDPGAG